MNKIQVFYINADSSLTGVSQHIIDLIENLDKKKFLPKVISPAGPFADEIDKKVELARIDMRGKFDLAAAKKTRKQLKKWFSAKSSMEGIIHCHGVRSGFLGRLASIGLNAPVIYSEHLWTSDYHLSNPISEFLQTLGLWALDFFTVKTVAVSEAVADFLVKKKITRAEKIVVIYNGIELPSKVSSPLKNPLKCTIGTIGSLNSQKGFEYLIYGFGLLAKNFPDVSLRIAGEGPLREKLEKIAGGNLGKDKIEFIGFQKNLEKFYQNIDIYVQPSMSESFGYSLAKAMSYGLPVVATRVGGMTELVKKGSGALVPAKDGFAIEEAIKNLIENPHEAIKMGKRGRERIKEFSIKTMVSKTEGLYEQIIKTRT